MRDKRDRKAGFTLVEATISMAILAIVGMTFAASLRSMAGLTTSGATRADLVKGAAEALEGILEDLRMSGFVVVGGFDYPHLFDEGVPGAGFEAHAHLVPPGAATENEYDFGVTREIVFLHPADADGDNLPDVDADGQLLWSADEISYTLNVDAWGNRVLQRRVNAAAPKVVAEGVERVVFDSAATSALVPPLAVRVRIDFRVRDEEGHEVRHSVEGTTRLRNGNV